MNISEKLKAQLAEQIYEYMRTIRMLPSQPTLKPWAELSEQEHYEMRESMRLWLSGLGANEVSAEWFARSGSWPAFLPEQFEGYDISTYSTSWGLAALQLIQKLVDLAELGLQQQEDKQDGQTHS